MKVVSASEQSAQQTPAAPSALERAKAILMSEGVPPIDQNKIEPENASVAGVTEKKEQKQEVAEEIKQLDNSEASDSSKEETKSSEEGSKESAEEEKPLSSQFANLARKEKAIRAKAQEMKAKEEAFRARELEMSQKLETLAELEKNPIKALRKLGWTYDKLTEAVLADTESEASSESASSSSDNELVRKLEKEIAEIKQAQERSLKAQEEAQQAQYKQAISMLKAETKQLVDGDDSFELVRATGSYDDVVELIEKRFVETQEVMTVAEAARIVEDYLVEEATKLTSAKKIQQKLVSQSSQKTESASNKSQEVTKQPAKTLTNSVGANRQLSRIERAILAAKGELK